MTAPAIDSRQPSRHSPVAITGIAFRLPGASDDDAFWALVREGRSAIVAAPPDRPLLSPTHAGTLPDAGYLREIDRFDASFFSIPAEEAAAMDPQQRLLMEVAWEAVEGAGLTRASLGDRTMGVFVGVGPGDYARFAVGAPGRINPYTVTGNFLSVAANRLSYFLGLRGPSLAVDTACSSSLIALSLACQSLMSGECDRALAAGVNALLAPELSVALQRAGALSPDGRCRPFDAGANGYVRGEGCVVVVLERLDSALATGAPVRAQILGSAVNHNGTSNGLTAPSRQSQEAVLRDAYARAGVSPGEVDLVETQGTGTIIGDAIEANALGAVMSAGRAADRPCHLGALKANIGHLETAAGAAALVKCVLALERAEIPPIAALDVPNPHVDFAALKLELPRAAKPWPPGARQRLVGLSAFGIGGSNAHLVLSAAPPRDGALDAIARSAPVLAVAPPPTIITLSAHTPEALRARAGQIAALVRACAPEALPSIGHTCALRRSPLPSRLVLVARDPESAARALEHHAAGADAGPDLQLVPAGAGRRKIKIAFILNPISETDAREFLRSAEVDPLFSSARGLAGVKAPSGFDPAVAGVSAEELEPVLRLGEIWTRLVGVPELVIPSGGVGAAAAVLMGAAPNSPAPPVIASGAVLNQAQAVAHARAAASGAVEPIDASVIAAVEWGASLFIEVGGASSLTPSVRSALETRTPRVRILPSLTSGEPLALTLRRSAASAFALGRGLDWDWLLSGPQPVARLPPYPWQRAAHWLPPAVE